MAFTKLYKVIQDHALGYQSINTAADNDLAIYEDFNEEHGSGLSASTSWFQRLGRHNAPTIPRAVANVQVRTSAVGVVVPVMSAVSQSEIILSVRRESTGVYFFPAPFEWVDMWVEVTPSGLNSTTRQAHGHYMEPTEGIFVASPQEAGLLVYLFEKDGSWAAADYDFTVCVFGYGDW